MADAKMDEIEAHVRSCPICSAANRRVNDFCDVGLAMFYEWAKDNPPVGAEMAEISKEQFDRLLAERRRARKAGSN
jgi:hypothetical protein